MSAVTSFEGGVGTVCILFCIVNSRAGEVGLWVLRASFAAWDFCERYRKVGRPDC
jgi:hypothetical protein